MLDWNDLLDALIIDSFIKYLVSSLVHITIAINVETFTFSSRQCALLIPTPALALASYDYMCITCDVKVLRNGFIL